MRTRLRWLVVVAALLAPASLTAGPRVDLTGEGCRSCCEAYCPLDDVGFFNFCFPDLDGLTCIYNDRHFLWVGGCD